MGARRESVGAWRWVVVVVGAASLLLLTVTMRTVVSEPDGIVMATYGFPLPWHRPSLASSCQYLIDLDALLFDVVAHVIALTFTLAAVRHSVGSRRVPGGLVIVAAIPIACFALLLGFGLVVGFEQIAHTPDDIWRVESREMVWGLGAPLGGPRDLGR